MFSRGSRSPGSVELGGRAGGRQERAAEVDGSRPCARPSSCPPGSGSSSSGSCVSTGTNSCRVRVALGVGDRPHDAVVVAHHGDRPAVDRRVAGDDEHDVVAALVLQRRLDLDERAGHGERVERRDLVAAQVEALVGLGEREARAERRARRGRRRRRRRRRASGGRGSSTMAPSSSSSSAAVRRRRVEALADGDQASVPARMPAPWSEGQPALLDREQQAQGEGQDRADRRAGRAGASGGRSRRRRRRPARRR